MMGQGSLSPGVGLGTNSEEGTATMNDVISLNALGLPGSNIGYAINDPTGTTPGAITASQIAAQQNPTLANALFGLAGLIGPAGSILGTAAGIAEGRGLLSAALNSDLGQAVTGALTSSDKE